MISPIRLQPAEETRSHVVPEDEVEPLPPDPYVEPPGWWALFREWIAAQWIRYQISRAKIDENEKCKACGWRTGRIEFDPKSKQIIHQCMKCRAYWPEDPMLDPREWLR